MESLKDKKRVIYNRCKAKIRYQKHEEIVKEWKRLEQFLETGKLEPK